MQSVCGILAVDPLTAVSLTFQCCTRGLELLVSLFLASQSSEQWINEGLADNLVRMEKGSFFNGLPGADDDAGFYTVVFVVCVINIFLSTKRGGEFGQL